MLANSQAPSYGPIPATTFREVRLAAGPTMTATNLCDEWNDGFRGRQSGLEGGLSYTFGFGRTQCHL
jgi:hypothetical protein